MKTKSANLLAKGYELIDGITVPVGTSNVDLGVEGKEPQNAEKLTIAVGNEKINMYVFRPANYKAGEKTPLVYFIHGGGYHFGNVSMDEPKIQGIADGSAATVIERCHGYCSRLYTFPGSFLQISHGTGASICRTPLCL